ncbi:MAG: hypothetical protein R2779_09285 [Crocinitomicaceae bacterium]
MVYPYTIPATGCSNTDTVIVTVQPPVTPTFNPTDSLCLNDGVVNLNTVYAPSHWEVHGREQELQHLI